MKKYYISKIKSISMEVLHDENTGNDIYRYTSNVSYKECTKEQAMERLERDRKLINMIDKLRR